MVWELAMWETRAQDSGVATEDSIIRRRRQGTLSVQQCQRRLAAMQDMVVRFPTVEAKILLTPIGFLPRNFSRQPAVDFSCMPLVISAGDCSFGALGDSWTIQCSKTLLAWSRRQAWIQALHHACLQLWVKQREKKSIVTYRVLAY